MSHLLVSREEPDDLLDREERTRTPGDALQRIAGP
jgi:hypothetical protein